MIMLRRPSTWSTKAWIAIGAGFVAIVVATAIWLIDREDGPQPQHYLREETVCLLTDDRGIHGADAAPVWEGMEQAAARTEVRMQYLSVKGPQTVERATSHVGALVQRGCELIFAAGELAVSAVIETAPRFPDQRFVIVGASAAGDNVSTVDEDVNAVRDLIVTKTSLRSSDT